MLTLIRHTLVPIATDLLVRLAHPGAGMAPGEERRRRWVRNLWFLLLPTMIGMAGGLSVLIPLTIIGFILSFMILDEVGR